MKCRFLIATKPLNHEWSQEAFDAARDAGTTYDVPRHLSFGPGYEKEDPLAWIHCCPGEMNAPAIAEPADDECRAKVKVWMEVNRPQGIATLKAQLDQIELITDERDKKHLLALGRAYGLIGTGKPAESPEAAATAVE